MTNPPPADSPAFPYEERIHPRNAGLTKREWLAGLAMQGLLANMDKIDFDPELAVDCADALLRELSRPEPGASGGEGG